MNIGVNLSWIALFICIGVTRTAWAGDGEFRSLMGARSMTQLAEVLRESERLRHSRAVCDVQLRSGKIPVGCFQVLELERRKELESGRDRTWLEDLCLERAKSSRSYYELEATLSAEHVPPHCRKVAENRIADLAYEDQAARPADFFSKNRRFRAK